MCISETYSVWNVLLDPYIFGQVPVKPFYSKVMDDF